MPSMRAQLLSLAWDIARKHLEWSSVLTFGALENCLGGPPQIKCENLSRNQFHCKLKSVLILSSKLVMQIFTLFF